MVAYFTTLEPVSHKFTIYPGSMTKRAGNKASRSRGRYQLTYRRFLLPGSVACEN